MAVRPVVLEAMIMSILLEHHTRLLELVAKIEKLKNPDDPEELEAIEKSLQPPSPADMLPCQTTIETTLQPEDS
jgi:hypothetical protein